VRVLVTGANGFLGRRVVAELARRGHEVRAMVRPAAAVERLGWPGSVEIVRADLRAARDLTDAFEGVDVLVHLAAVVAGSEEAQFAGTVAGTERLLEAMARSETRRLVLASSFSVYDWRAARRVLHEGSPLEEAPGLYERDGYAVAKVWQERVASRMAQEHGWGLTILRPGFIWGLGNEHLACLGQKVGPLYLVFGPAARLPLTHVENCADLFATAAEDPRADGQVLNVVDGDDVRRWRYTGEYLRRSGVRAARVPVPYALAWAGVGLAFRVSRWAFRGRGKLPGLLVPCRFAARFKPLRYRRDRPRALLGWSPRLPFAEALRRTFGSAAVPDAPAPPEVLVDA
jgi:UDP-glucose 4-epimerase